MPDATPKRVFDGDTSFILGMNSLSNGIDLPAGSYAFGWNVINRGGIIRSRPGFNTRYQLPDGKLQGFVTFTPRRGLPQQVAVVDGKIYVSDYPFNGFRAVAGVSMSNLANQVYFAQATKSVKTNPDGSLSLITPFNLLILQDGINPPAYYDGTSVKAITGDLATPQGTIMAWDGFRLWVAREDQLFASDIADPLSFVEQQFNTLGGLSSFILPGKITAMGMTGGTQLPQLLVYTDTSTTTFQSQITNRSQWSSTPLFQRIVLPGVGCTSQRSLIQRAGELSWYSQNGWATLDSAQVTMQTAEIKFLDSEMVRSKSRLSDDLTTIAASTFENFLLLSVPNSSRYNSHTWVHDSSPQPLANNQAPSAWCSLWTGVQPVQWATITRNGNSRLFCASTDLDGKNRVYEAFQEVGQDNGVDLPWAVELRPYTGQTAEPKTALWAELYLVDVLGQFDVQVSWAGAERGLWKDCLTTHFKAARGNVDASKSYNWDSVFYELKSQSRQPRTQEIKNLDQDNALSSCGIEFEKNEAIDSAFQLRIDGSGRAGIKMVRFLMEVNTDFETRELPAGEDEESYVRFDGAASTDESALDVAPVTFTSSKTSTQKLGALVVESLGEATSLISQSDADKLATQIADMRCANYITTYGPVHVGSSKAP